MVLLFIRSLAGYILSTPPPSATPQSKGEDNDHLDDGFWPPIPPRPPPRTLKPPYQGTLKGPVPYCFPTLRKLLPRNVKTWLDGDIRANLEAESRSMSENMTIKRPGEGFDLHCPSCGGCSSPLTEAHLRSRDEYENCTNGGLYEHGGCDWQLSQEIELLREQIMRLSLEIRRERRHAVRSNLSSRRNVVSSSKERIVRRKPRKRIIRKTSSSSFLSSSEASGSGYRPPSAFQSRMEVDYYLPSARHHIPRTPSLSHASFSPSTSPSLPEFDLLTSTDKKRFTYSLRANPLSVNHMEPLTLLNDSAPRGALFVNRALDRADVDMRVPDGFNFVGAKSPQIEDLVEQSPRNKYEEDVEIALAVMPSSQ